MTIDNYRLSHRRLQFIGLSVDKVMFKSINVINIKTLIGTGIALLYLEFICLNIQISQI